MRSSCFKLSASRHLWFPMLKTCRLSWLLPISESHELGDDADLISAALLGESLKGLSDL